MPSSLPTPTLSQLALEIAISQLGTHEQGGSNLGPEVNEYLGSVHLTPGNPWCAALMFWCFERASRRLGLVNPVPRTGSSLRLWELADKECRDSNPAVGRVYVLKHSPTTGHAGICRTLDALGNCGDEVSGNTNAAGSREGNTVAMHHGTPEVSHGGVLLGWLDMDRAPTLPNV